MSGQPLSFDENATESVRVVANSALTRHSVVVSAERELAATANTIMNIQTNEATNAPARNPASSLLIISLRPISGNDAFPLVTAGRLVSLLTNTMFVIPNTDHLHQTRYVIVLIFEVIKINMHGVD